MAALTVPTIFTAVDKMSSVLSKMQGNVGKFASESQKRYAAMSRSMQNIQTNASQIGMAAGIMGAAIMVPLTLSVKKAIEFEDQMANVATLVDTTKESITDMGKEVLDVFVKVPVPLHDLTEALYKIRSAGIPAADAMDVLNKSALLGISGRGTAVQAADALTSAINVFRDEGMSANKIASMLFETVRLGKTTIEGMSESFGATANVVHAGGVKLQDFLAATAAMTVMGEPASQAMNQVRSSVFALEKPTQRMKYLFHELGVKDVRELIGKFGNLGNAMKAVEDMGAKRGVNLAKAWGKVQAFAAVISLTGNGKAAYNNNLTGMANSELDLAAAYADKLNTMKAQSQLLQNELQYFAIKVGAALLPILVKLAKFIQPVVEAFGHWIDNNPLLAKVILITAGAIGSLLLVIAPLAFAVAGVASVMKIWAGYQLLLAEKAALATAATVAETAAVGGLETAVGGIEAEFVAAEVAATGFFATLSAFVLPAALVALSGLAIWKYMQAVEQGDKMLKANHSADPYEFFNPNTPGGKTGRFPDAAKESAYQSWYVQQRKAGMPDSLIQRTQFDAQKGGAFKPLIDTTHFKSVIDSLHGGQSSRVDLHINDPGGHVDNSKTTAPAHIPVSLHQGSTTGKQ